MEEIKEVKCQFILAKENEENVEVIEGEDILLTYGDQKKMGKCLDNCVYYEKNNFYVKDIKFNCDIKIAFDKDRYNLEHYAGYVADQLQKINRLSCLQEVQALTECVTKNINEIVYLTSIKEYRFFSYEKQEEILKILSNSMQDEKEETKLNNEGVYKTSTGIILFLSKPIIKKDEYLVLDDNKVEEEEQIQLKILIANSDDEEQQQWFEFPMKNQKEIRTSIIKKFHSWDSGIIKKTWSNCGLIEPRNYKIDNLEEFVLAKQEELEQLNEFADAELVRYYTTIAIVSTPFRILKLIKGRLE